MINEPRPSADVGGKTQIRLFTWTGVDEFNINQELVKEFQAEHPDIAVKINNVPGSQSPMQKLETMFAAKNAPDVISIHGAYYVGFADAGVLADLDGFAENDSEFRLDDIHPRLVELCRYEGTLYSLPRYTSVYAIFYNKALFDAEGLPYPGVGSWTWDDYLKAAKGLTKDLDGDGAPDQWGCTIDFWGARLYPWLWANGADLMDEARETCTIDSDNAIGAIQFLCDLRHTHRVCPQSTSTQHDSALGMFARGAAGMYMSGPWNIQDLSEAEGLDWDVAPIPKKKRRATMLGTENYAIYSGTKHPKEAWELYKFLLSARAQAMMAQELDKMPSRVSVLQGAYAKGNVDYDRQVYIDALDYAQLPPNFPEYSRVEGILQSELDHVWLGDVPVAEGLKSAARKVNKKLEELRKEE